MRGHGPLPALRISVMITAGLDKVEDVPVVEVPMSQIRDWDTFHDTFAQRLGFPDFYGRNMDGWIDCRPTPTKTTACVRSPPAREVLTLQLEDCREFRTRCPEIYQVLIDCAAFVNWRRIEQGERPVLALSYH